MSENIITHTMRKFWYDGSSLKSVSAHQNKLLRGEKPNLNPWTKCKRSKFCKLKLLCNMQICNNLYEHLLTTKKDVSVKIRTVAKHICTELDGGKKWLRCVAAVKKLCKQTDDKKDGGKPSWRSLLSRAFHFTAQWQLSPKPKQFRSNY